MITITYQASIENLNWLSMWVNLSFLLHISINTPNLVSVFYFIPFKSSKSTTVEIVVESYIL